MLARKPRTPPIGSPEHFSAAFRLPVKPENLIAAEKAHAEAKAARLAASERLAEITADLFRVEGPNFKLRRFSRDDQTKVQAEVDAITQPERDTFRALEMAKAEHSAAVNAALASAVDEFSSEIHRRINDLEDLLWTATELRGESLDAGVQITARIIPGAKVLADELCQMRRHLRAWQVAK